MPIDSIDFDRLAIEELYAEHCASGSAMAHHLPMLRTISEGLAVAVEFGVKHGGSTCALLLGAEHVISYDIVPTKRAEALRLHAGSRWDFRVEDSRRAEPTPCDLLFVDSLHTYDQVAAELAVHGDSVRSAIVFHDSVTFGSIGAHGETGTHAAGVLGIRPAIDHWMIPRPEWRVTMHDVQSHGLLVLRRREP